jgi:methylated-DNA-[protein]-cysteine S-methyltransferase
MDLLLDRLPSPIGTIVLVCGAGALRAVAFDGDESWMRRWLGRQYGPHRLVPGRAAAAIRGPVEAYFEGHLEALDQVPVETVGTPFQQMVWSALRAIPAGTTATYGQLAARIGKPRSSRAVGMATGSNPIPIVVPCHRVIGANGSLTGYGGGLDRKRWLLVHERAFPVRPGFVSRDYDFLTTEVPDIRSPAVRVHARRHGRRSSLTDASPRGGSAAR